MSESGGFFQEGPELKNTFTENRWLKAYLKHKIPKPFWSSIEEDLRELGHKCAGEYLQIAQRAERERPELVRYDSWGRRVDELRVSPAWRELQNIAAREGLVSLGYAREQKEFSRLYQFSKLYLFHPSSAFFTCPLAMADGAAKVLENFGTTPIHKEAFRHLTASEPEEFWTSGQWMTEKTGGSDVSGTSTLARVSGGEIRLSGVKWFSSATTSEMALALARYEDSPAGSRGLSLFLVPMYQAGGQLNNIEVLRLKDKLGTWALPTAELELKGALAYQVGERDQGVKTVASMLNITRLYNSICACGQMTRALDQLRDYSNRRIVFGQPLKEQILHQVTFVREEMRSLAGFLLTMEMVERLGREECGIASSEDHDMLRLFTPIAKLFTAKSSLQVASEVIEGFGGAGYVEDVGVSVHLRDAQVFSIWEGATNVMSLDLLRVVQKTSALASFAGEMNQRLQGRSDKWHTLQKQIDQWMAAEPVVQVANARDLALQMAWHYAYALLVGWSEAESPANQKVIAAWLEQMDQCLTPFQMTTASGANVAKSVFLESLV